MAGKNAKKATSTSSKIPPDKLPQIKPELVTPSQLVRYNPQQASPQNKPSSSRMVPLGKPVQSSSSFAKALVESYDPYNKKIVPATPAAQLNKETTKKLFLLTISSTVKNFSKLSLNTEDLRTHSI